MMGVQLEKSTNEKEEIRQFMKCLLNDVHALEKMHSMNSLESDVRRIGVEQELVLVDETWHPSPNAEEILEKLDDKDFTTEIAKFNLEFNVDPMLFGGDCLRDMHRIILEKLDRVRKVAGESATKVLLVGILPTIRKTDLSLDNMTARERYFALNEALTEMRRGEYTLNIKGKDDMSLSHENIMLEACNTSFQIHFQVGPEEFSKRYNIAQAVLGPVLATAANSPVFLGRRLWRETRIALFEQSIDTRSGHYLRELSPRVSFGTRWVRESILEIFQEDIARFKVLFGMRIDEDPFKKLDEGMAPELHALRLHNGTIYRWNRPCYGVSPDGVAQLRIENRVLPSGPTAMDEVANAAFWFGMMSGMSVAYDDITKVMDFDDAKDNFISAATHGLGAQFSWVNGKRYPAQQIIIEELLPLAREGLYASNINPDDISTYLDVIEERVRSEQTGAQWILKSLGEMKYQGVKGEQVNAVTSGIHKRQLEDVPVHSWDIADLQEAGGWQRNYIRVDQYMTTDIFTVRPDDPVSLVANLMDWNRIRHVMVEDDQHKLKGMISHRNLLRLYGRHDDDETLQQTPVSTIMVKSPISISPETLTLEAIRLMRTHMVSCLPVVKGDVLVGVVTESIFLGMVTSLLEQQ